MKHSGHRHESKQMSRHKFESRHHSDLLLVWIFSFFVYLPLARSIFSYSKHCSHTPSRNALLIFGLGRLSLALLALRVISIIFLLVISMLCKTAWSWELRTWSHKMNLTDILSTSPHYFCRKWIGQHMRIQFFHLRV